MATDNRRVAAYLPPEIDDRFKAFKIERGLATEDEPNSNDSKALIQILSEYFGVSQAAHSAAHYVTIEQFNDLSTRVEKLYGLLQQSDDRIEEAASEIKSELLSELKNSSPNSDYPGQLSFLQPEQDDRIEQELVHQKVSQGDLNSELSEGLSARKLAERLHINRKVLPQKREEEGFMEWTRELDPEGFGWRYCEDTRYYPCL